MRRVALISLAVGILLLAGLLMAASSPVVGAWECEFVTPDGDKIPATLTFTEADGRLAGTASSAEGSAELQDVTFADGALSFKVDYQGDTVEVTAKLDGDKLDGEWKNSADSGKVSGSKKPA